MNVGGANINDLTLLAKFIRERNLLERKITAITGRPAAIGHIGEYIASRVFHIVLGDSASNKGSDGRFSDGALKGHTVNIKWYAKHNGLLDIAFDGLPDYYLVLTGPRLGAMSSRGQVLPWLIENVFLFDAPTLVDGLKRGEVKIGIATSVRQHYWLEAEIYPTQHNKMLELSKEQCEALAQFSSQAGG